MDLLKKIKKKKKFVVLFSGVYHSKKASKNKTKTGFMRPKQERKMKIFKNLSNEKQKNKFTR